MRRVGAAGQHNRHARAHDNAGRLRTTQVFQLLGQHVAGLQIGHDQNVGVARDLGHNALDFCRHWRHGVVKGQRAINQTAGNLAALGHFGQGGGVHGGAQFGRHGFQRRQNRHFG